MSQNIQSPWIAIDIETTGLDAHEDLICEIGMAVLDKETLRIVGPYFETVVSGDGQYERLIETKEDGTPRDELVYNMHRDSGLLEELEYLATEVDIDFIGTADTETEAILWLQESGIIPQSAILVGSSLKFDRTMLDHHMPQLSEYLHYRMIDVSTLKELARHDHPELEQSLLASLNPMKKHRVMPDISDSLAELAFYRREYLK